MNSTDAYSVIALLIILIIITMVTIEGKNPPSQEITMRYKKDTKGICYAFYTDSAIATVPCDKVGL